jgi:glutathione S-transferase
MKLYYSPLACSMASHIVANELALALDRVLIHDKRTPDGTPYTEIHPLGLVPALALDSGELLTENAAILQYLGEPIAPAPGIERARLHKWLSFIGTELHKLVFAPLLDPASAPAVREAAIAKAELRLAYVADQLGAHDYLLGDRFSVADAYLFTVLNWAQVTPIDLSPWPALGRFLARMRARPAVQAAFGAEVALYLKEKERKAAAAPAQPPR